MPAQPRKTASAPPPAPTTEPDPALDEVEPEQDPALTAAPAEPEPEPAEGGLCEICYPDGWGERNYSAGCEHGSYSRPDPLHRIR